MKRWSAVFLVGTLLALSPPLLADDLTGADRLLCSVGRVVACLEDGECEELLAMDLNVPQFIEVDLAQKRLATTRASGEDRTTSIANLVRSEGRIVIQGHERGRAFSFVVHEATGLVTAAVATDGLAVAVYGACTPMAAVERSKLVKQGEER